MKKVENVFENFLSVEEKDILKKADMILSKLSSQLGHNKRTQSLSNGDLVDSYEICRVRGILSHYIENNYLLVTDND